MEARLAIFTQKVAPHLKSLQALTLGEGIPNSHMREIIRACRRSPLREVKLFGPVWPAGFCNRWCEGDRFEAPDYYYKWIEWVRDSNPMMLEDETDKDHIQQLELFEVSREDINTRAAKEIPYQYRTEMPHEPMLRVIAKYFSDTIESISLRGLIGCPIIRDGTTQERGPFLEPLKHFHNLRFFETTMVLYQPGAKYRPDRFHYELALSVAREEFIPATYWSFADEHTHERYAQDVCDIVGHRLSKEARERPGGVHISAIFGTPAGDLGIDVWIGANDAGRIRVLRHSRLHERPDEAYDLAAQTMFAGTALMYDR